MRRRGRRHDFNFNFNSGYVGASMSKNAMYARLQGRYPKGDFRKFYNVTEKSLGMLVNAGVIRNSEWHHTSKYCNITVFYAWREVEYRDMYLENKRRVDAWSREYERSDDAARQEIRDKVRSMFGVGEQSYSSEYDSISY